MRAPFIRVLGVGLAVGACRPTVPPDVTHNPPAPDLTPEIPMNPPEPEVVDTNLPAWESVVSGHPEGATNPPSPVLIVARDVGACFKDWQGGMMRLPEEVRKAGGRVVATTAEATGTQVQCPEGQPERLLAAWDALPAPGTPPK